MEESCEVYRVKQYRDNWVSFCDGVLFTEWVCVHLCEVTGCAATHDMTFTITTSQQLLPFFLLSFYLPLLLFCHNVRLFVYLFFSLHADLLLVSVSVVEMAHWESFSHLWHQLFLFIAASLWPVGWLLSSFFLLFCCVWCLLWNKMFSTLFFSSFNFTTSVSAQTVFTGMRGDCKV